MTHQQERMLGLLIVLTILSACAPGSESSWCAGENGDVVYSTAPGSVLALTPVWRFDPGETPLAYPVSIAVSDGGYAAVLDFMAADVIVVTPDGSWAGPWLDSDQVRAPFAVNWSQDSLVVFDARGDKVVWSSAGALVREEHLPAGLVESLLKGAGATWAGVLSDGTLLIQPLIEPDMTRPDPSRQRTSVLQIALSDPEPRSILEQEVRTLAPGLASRIAAPGWPFPRLSAAGDRYAVGGTRSEYVITVHHRGSHLTICRDDEVEKLRTDELGQTGSGPRVQTVLRAEKPDHPAAYGRIVLGRRGELLVQRDRPSAITDEIFGRPGALYDVIDAEGGFAGQVRAPEDVVLHAISGHSVWGIEDDGVQKRVVRFSLQEG